MHRIYVTLHSLLAEARRRNNDQAEMLICHGDMPLVSWTKYVRNYCKTPDSVMLPPNHPDIIIVPRNELYLYTIWTDEFVYTLSNSTPGVGLTDYYWITSVPRSPPNPCLGYLLP